MGVECLTSSTMELAWGRRLTGLSECIRRDMSSRSVDCHRVAARFASQFLSARALCPYCQEKQKKMNSMRLLIVDDEPLIRRGLRNGLSGLAGIEVIGECENGQQAVDSILADHPELVLLDVQMPDFDGLEVVR